MFLENSFLPIDFGSHKNDELLDIFIGTSGKKQINIESDSILKYIIVIDNSDVDIDVNIVGSSTNLEIFGIFLGNVKSNILTSLLANKTSANVNLFCIVKDNSDIILNGSIKIGDNIQDVEGYLTEEQFLLGVPNHLSVSPILDISSSRVKASHSAKIHTLDKQKLFYMMAKGISLEESQKIVVKASLQAIFDNITTLNADQKETIFNQIIDSAFNN